MLTTIPAVRKRSDRESRALRRAKQAKDQVHRSRTTALDEVRSLWCARSGAAASSAAFSNTALPYRCLVSNEKSSTSPSSRTCTCVTRQKTCRASAVVTARSSRSYARGSREIAASTRAARPFA
jgi:hypothetical protein